MKNKYSVKINNNIIITLLLISLLLSGIFILFLIHSLIEADLSINPVYKLAPTSIKNSLHLVSYASGPEVFFKNRNILAYSAINRGVDFIYNYRREHIEPEFIKNNPILNEAYGAGYWLWKPYFILKTLEKIPEGDLLLYADSGGLIRQPIREFLDRAFLTSKKDITLFFYDPEIHGLVANIATGDTFNTLGCYGDHCRSGKHVWAGLIAVKNTADVRKFIKEWLDYCRNVDLLQGTNLRVPNYPEFVQQQNDEAILSVLANRDGHTVNFIKMDQEFFEYFYMHRRKTDLQNKALLGFSNIKLKRFERKLLNRPVIKEIRYLTENIFDYIDNR